MATTTTTNTTHEMMLSFLQKMMYQLHPGLLLAQFRQEESTQEGAAGLLSSSFLSDMGDRITETFERQMKNSCYGHSTQLSVVVAILIGMEVVWQFCRFGKQVRDGIRWYRAGRPSPSMDERSSTDGSRRNQTASVRCLRYMKLKERRELIERCLRCEKFQRVKLMLKTKKHPSVIMKQIPSPESNATSSDNNVPIRRKTDNSSTKMEEEGDVATSSSPKSAGSSFLPSFASKASLSGTSCCSMNSHKSSKRRRRTSTESGYKSENDLMCCAICLVEYRGADDVSVSDKCPHMFHKDCIVPWLETHTTCPCCRIDLIPDGEDKKEGVATTTTNATTTAAPVARERDRRHAAANDEDSDTDSDADPNYFLIDFTNGSHESDDTMAGSDAEEEEEIPSAVTNSVRRMMATTPTAAATGQAPASFPFVAGAEQVASADADWGWYVS